MDENEVHHKLVVDGHFNHPLNQSFGVHDRWLAKETAERLIREGKAARVEILDVSRELFDKGFLEVLTRESLGLAPLPALRPSKRRRTSALAERAQGDAAQRADQSDGES